MEKSVFRKKSIDRVSSPEQLNDYIRVSSPSIWVLLAAIIVLLIGVIVWSVFGTVPAKTASGEVRSIHPITFVIN